MNSGKGKTKDNRDKPTMRGAVKKIDVYDSGRCEERVMMGSEIPKTPFSDEKM